MQPCPQSSAPDLAPIQAPPSSPDPVLVASLTRLAPSYPVSTIVAYLDHPRSVSQRAGLDLAEAVHRAGYKLPAREGAPFTLATRQRPGWPVRASTLSVRVIGPRGCARGRVAHPQQGAGA